MKMLIALLAIMACAASSSVQAADPALGSVPPFLVYQSQLFDDGGNPISDGEVDVTFRISDGQGKVLYEEQQTIEAIRGQLTALVGNGVDLDGAPTGGLSIEMLSPVGPRYLEVEVEGFSALEPMEVASVPYSLYASRALGAAEGAIDSAAIADGSVELDDLSDELVDKLVGELTGGGGVESLVLREELDTLYRQPSAASTIGVSPDFVYSGANDLQAVLQDLDRALQRRDERVSAEAAARAAADSAEVQARQAADAAEAQARQAADNALQANINSEASSRQDADNTLQSNVDAEVAERSNADATKVSKSGDTMTGNLEIGGDLVANELRATTGIGSASAPDANTIYADSIIFAWGHVDADGNLLAGFNCSVEKLINEGGDHPNGPYYPVSFLRSASSSDSYAATVTFHWNSLLGENPSYMNEVIYGRTANGFKVAYDNDGESRNSARFSFIVIGY